MIAAAALRKERSAGREEEQPALAWPSILIVSYDLIGVRVQDDEDVEDAVARSEEIADEDTAPTAAEWKRMCSESA